MWRGFLCFQPHTVRPCSRIISRVKSSSFVRAGSRAHARNFALIPPAAFCRRRPFGPLGSLLMAAALVGFHLHDRDVGVDDRCLLLRAVLDLLGIFHGDLMCILRSSASESKSRAARQRSAVL